jgi:hypothetical protein
MPLSLTRREELQAALEAAEVRALRAEEQLRQVSEQLRDMRSTSEAELGAAAARYEAELAQLRLAAGEAGEATEAAKR